MLATMEHDKSTDLMTGLDAVTNELATARMLNDALAGQGDLHSQALIEQMHSISVSCEALAVDAAVMAVNRRHISRRAAADRLRMHSHTLQRIIDERTQGDTEEV